MNQITPFQFKNKNVRVFQKDGEPWFVAKDVCEVLGLKNVSQAIDRLDLDEKGIIQNDTLGGKQKMSTVSESGLFALILRSDKTEAKIFRKWVTSEVLPQIRKTGSYCKIPTRSELAMMVLKAEEENGSLKECVELIKPLAQYGSIAKNGQPRTGLRRASFVAAAVRNLASFQLRTRIAELQLELALSKEGWVNA